MAAHNGEFPSALVKTLWEKVCFVTAYTFIVNLAVHSWL